jgi:hypothetical protein
MMPEGAISKIFYLFLCGSDALTVSPPMARDLVSAMSSGDRRD